MSADSQVTQRYRTLLLTVALGGAIMMLGVLCYPLVTGEVFIEDDLSAQNLPHRFFYSKCLAEGDSFLWLPHLFRGFYVHGEGQTGMCHPVHYLWHLWFPLEVAFNLEILFIYPLAFIGVYLLARRWGVEHAAACLGATMFTFAGYPMTHYVHPMIASIVAHIPLILYAIDVAMRTRDGVAPSRRAQVGASLGIGLLTASQLLLGHPQHVYFSCMIEGMYVLFLLPGLRNRWVLVLLAGTKALALMMGAVQVLPTFHFVATTSRGGEAYDFAVSGAMHPLTLLQTVCPYLFNRRGWTMALCWDLPYLGAAAPPLLVWGLLHFRKLGVQRRLAAWCMALCVFGLIMALGERGYLYSLFAMVPVINKFRGPERLILFYQLGASILTAIAFAHLAASVQRRERAGLWRSCLLALPLLLSITVALTMLAIHRNPTTPFLELIRDRLAPTRNILAGPVFVTIATGLVIAAARGWRIALLGIVAFTVFDVAYYGLRHHPRDTIDGLLARIDVPEDIEDSQRIDADFHPVYQCTGPSMLGVRVALGYDGAIPNDTLDYYSQVPAMRVAGVRWRRARYGAAPELAEAAEAGLTWLEIEDPMPRARLVAHAQVSDDPYRDIETIDVSATALVAKPLDLDAAATGQATITEDRPGRIRVQANATGRALLIVSERYDPGWQAQIDGQPVDVIPVYGDTIACLIEPGAHEIALRFAPPSFRWGMIVSLAGLALTLLYHAAALKWLPQPQVSNATA